MAQTETRFYPGMGLTTTKAPFIEVARSKGSHPFE